MVLRVPSMILRVPSMILRVPSMILRAPPMFHSTFFCASLCSLEDALVLALAFRARAI